MDIPYQSPRSHHGGGLPPPIYVDRPGQASADRYHQSPSRNHRLDSKFSPTLPPIPSSVTSGVDIPGANRFDFHVPPPLPPPRFLPMSSDYQQHDDPYRANGSASRYGSYPEDVYEEDEGPNYKRREGSGAVVANKDEGYSSLSFSSIRSPSHNKDFDPRRPMSHDMFQFRPDAKDYDNALLKKLDSRRGLDSPSPMRRSSALSSSMQDPIGPRNYERLHTQLKPLSLPIQTRTAPSLVDSPSRWSETPLSSAASPRSALSTAPPYYRSAASDLSSMSGTMDYERSPPAPATNGLPLRTRRRTDSVSVAATDDDTNTLASSDVHDVRMEDADDVESGASQQMRRLEISDHHTSPYGHHHYQPSTPYANSAGQKRRASSPALDEQQQHALLHQGPPPLPHLNTSTEGLNHHYQQQQHHGNSNHHRRGSRVSPTPRSAVHLHSARSYASGASSSLSSASASEPSPFGRRSSPGSGQSPGAMSPMASSAVTDVGSPYATPVSAVSPRAAVMSGIRTVHESSRRRQPQQVSSPREMDNGPAVVSTKVGSSKISGMGILMCECCPKKPKRFETQEELSAHEAEKQYECSFCGNRFKNKNEMERHQNSLHVRRHSWSCAALQSYDRAFHESTAHPGEADSCGYCGEDYYRSGPPVTPASTSGGVTVRTTTDQDWEERIRHLQEVHKFRECNSSKKFFRADHFRQHLKHSHAGTSGKWTNMLENACMLEEDSSPR